MGFHKYSGFAAIALAGLVFTTNEAAATTVELGSTGSGDAFSTYQPALALTPLIQTSGSFYDLGMVRWFAGNFAPGGFEKAEGQELSIASNTALFSKLGTTYGGDGRTTFKLPDLQGRSIIGAGGSYALGTQVGQPFTSLAEENLAPHAHGTDDGVSSSTGGGVGFSTMMPGLALDHEIVTQGVFPSRSGSSAAPEETMSFVLIDAAADGAGDRERPNVASADGAVLDIASNSALFSLNGTTYGGDGRTNFALPDIQDRVVTGTGRGPGLSTRTLGGETGTNADHVMTVAEMPTHLHTDPEFGLTDPAGGGVAFSNLQEEVSLNWVISLNGVFPSRGGTGAFGEPFIGEIALFSGNFAPGGWAMASGQLLAIAGNEALFSILGTTYGGDGRTTFALPDLRGRTPIGAGFGPGGLVRLGQRFGTETTTLATRNLPAHTHTIERGPDLPPVPLPAGGWLLLTALGAPLALRRKRS